MPKIKQLEKCKHPNSRRTKALAKQMKKQHSRDKSKLSNNIKLNLVGEKFVWFRDNLDKKLSAYTPKEINELILKYLSRFNEELEQIHIKQSIGNRKNRQHANREDIINLTVNREKEEYDTCGIEIPNLLDPVQFDMLKTWNGELRFLQNFKLKRLGKRSLEEVEKKIAKCGKPNKEETVSMADICIVGTKQNNIGASLIDIDNKIEETLPTQTMDIGS